MSTTTTSHVFYQPGTGWVHDYAVQLDGGEWVTRSGRTLDQLKEGQPDMIVCTEDEAWQQIEAAAKSAPVLIDREQFEYALNVLPPAGWIRAGDCESFKMIERDNGRVTRIYVRLGENFFRFADLFTTPHADAVRLVEAAAPALLASRQNQ
ncbi:hypothetical protein GIW54_12920 [Pseudomonas proteolytica]|uniref:Uncharacterized protein n=1 Tax=Pseudomonas proteolytica TaxID=219574 RepID=A0AAW5AHQ4_9PSED|nr:hypothetical protein [Pseudomonas proteolytica]MCF5059283.1 hypothetical protein [Pseudomonas proteolytica]MCF5101651.1 hypothetical protein [Pseudomonas proteolytica]